MQTIDADRFGVCFETGKNCLGCALLYIPSLCTFRGYFIMLTHFATLEIYSGIILLLGKNSVYYGNFVMVFISSIYQNFESTLCSSANFPCCA